ncbi:MAG: 30S ribosomal protein S9 [Anaerolineaceae bacterium]|nr:30S ribosomal protein S9 [Anaerolineaceae bacterium]
MAQYTEGIGRRKSSTARVRVMDGSGHFVVNDRDIHEFFPRLGDTEAILAVFGAYGKSQNQFDVSVKVKGGGVSGQTGAVLLGLARSLIKITPDAVAVLRKAGFLTRDPREKERKKPGLKRARKAPTYTKR